MYPLDTLRGTFQPRLRCPVELFIRNPEEISRLGQHVHIQGVDKAGVDHDLRQTILLDDRLSGLPVKREARFYKSRTYFTR
jgi:hypothetical protein